MCKSGSLDFILSKPEDVDSSCSYEPLSSSTISVSPGKRPRRDSMDTATVSSTTQLEAPCKSPRVSEGSERPRSPSEADTVSLSLDSLYRTKDLSAVLPEDKLSKKQRKFLRQWHETFARENQSPCYSHETLTALATLVQARPQLIYDYLQNKFPGNSPTATQPDFPRLAPDNSSSDLTTTTMTRTPANPHLPPATLTLISKYLTTCARRRSPTDGRRSVNTGPLRCTFGCGYRTSRPFDWRRHEETHAPQDLWLCTLCCNQEASSHPSASPRPSTPKTALGATGAMMTTTTMTGTLSTASTSPFLGHRKDKFLKHVRDVHGQWEGEMVLSFSRVEVGARGGAAWMCPFCRVESSGWEERCRHVLGHFGDGEGRKGEGVAMVVDEREGSGDSDVDGDVEMESSEGSEDEGVGKGL